MKTLQNKSTFSLYLSYSILGVIFLVDCFVHFGDFGGIPYVIGLIILMWLLKPHEVLWFSATCGVLTVVAFLLGEDVEKLSGLMNRFMAIFTMVAIAMLIKRHTDESAGFEEQQRHLNSVVDKRTEGLKQVVDQLDELKIRLAESEELGHFGFWEYYPKTQNMIWSNGVFAIYGFPITPQAPSLHEFLEQCHTEDAQTLQRSIQYGLAEKKPYTVEYRLIMPDGNVKWIFNRGRPVTNKDGTVEVLVGTIQDVTTLKHNEESMQADRARYTTLFKSAAVGKVLMIPNKRILEVNEAFSRWIGYSEKSLLKVPLEKLIHEDDRSMDNAYAREMIAGEINFYQKEKRFLRRDGTILWGLFSVSPVHDVQDKVTCFAVEIIDITGPKNMQMALKKAQDSWHEAEEALTESEASRRVAENALNDSEDARRKAEEKLAYLEKELASRSGERADVYELTPSSGLEPELPAASITPEEVTAYEPSQNELGGDQVSPPYDLSDANSIDVNTLVDQIDEPQMPVAPVAKSIRNYASDGSSEVASEIFTETFADLKPDKAPVASETTTSPEPAPKAPARSASQPAAEMPTQEIDVLMASRDMVALIGLDGCYKRANSSLTRELGFSDGELDDQHFLNFIHQEDRERVHNELYNLQNGTSISNFVLRHMSKFDGYRRFAWTASVDEQYDVIHSVLKPAIDLDLLGPSTPVASEPAAPVEEEPTAVPEPELTPDPIPPVESTPRVNPPAEEVPVRPSRDVLGQPSVHTPPHTPPHTPEPITPEPVIPEPVIPEPVATEPVLPEPVLPEPVLPEPVLPEPTASEPVAPEPIAPEPIAEPIAPEPIAEPVAYDLAAPESIQQPLVPEPAILEPVVPEPTVPEPVAPEQPPVVEERAPEPVAVTPTPRVDPVPTPQDSAGPVAPPRPRHAKEVDWRRLADRMPFQVWMIGTDRMCKYVNKKVRDFTGLPFEQLEGKGWSKAVHPEDYRKYLEYYNKVFDDLKPMGCMYRLRRNDGVYRWMQESSIPLHRADGSFEGYLTTCMEVSTLTTISAKFENAFDDAVNLVDLKSALRPCQREDSERAFRDAVKIADALIANADEVPNADLARLMEFAGRRLVWLVSEILKFAKTDKDAHDLMKRSVSLETILESTLEMLAPLKREDSPRFQINYADQDVRVMVDKVLSHRVFENLLRNLIEWAESRVITLDISESGNQGLVEIKHIGPVLPDGFLNKLVSIYRTNGLSPLQRKAGLELSLINRLAQAMDGSLLIREHKEDGPMIEIRFQLAQSVEAEEKLPIIDESLRGEKTEEPAQVKQLTEVVEAIASLETPAPPPQPVIDEPTKGLGEEEILIHENGTNGKAISRHKVLVGETNSETQRLVRSLLQPYYDLTIVPSTEDLLKQADASQFDLLLLDVHLQGAQSGVDVLRELRRRPQYTRTPAIAVAANTTGIDQRELIDRAGFDGFLRKPYSIVELLETVERMIES